MYPPDFEIKDMTESNTSAFYLDLLLSIGRDGQLHISLRQAWRFWFLYYKLSVAEQHHSIFARLWRFYLTTHPIRQGLFLIWMFYSEGGAISNKLLGQGYVKERLWSSLRKFYGRYGDLIKQYEVPLSWMLHYIHIQWHPPLIRHDTIFDCYWSWPYYRIWLFTLLREVSIEHMQRVSYAKRGCLLIQIPGPVPLWDLQVF